MLTLSQFVIFPTNITVPITKNATYMMIGSADNLHLARHRLYVSDEKRRSVGTFKGSMGRIFWKTEGVEHNVPVDDNHAIVDRRGKVIAYVARLQTGAFAVNLHAKLSVTFNDLDRILCPACGTTVPHTKGPGSETCPQCGHNVYTHWPIFCKEYHEYEPIRSILRCSHPWNTSQHVPREA